MEPRLRAERAESTLASGFGAGANASLIAVANPPSPAERTAVDQLRTQNQPRPQRRGRGTRAVQRRQGHSNRRDHPRAIRLGGVPVEELAFVRAARERGPFDWFHEVAHLRGLLSGGGRSSQGVLRRRKRVLLLRQRMSYDVRIVGLSTRPCNR